MKLPQYDPAIHERAELQKKESEDVKARVQADDVAAKPEPKRAEPVRLEGEGTILTLPSVTVREPALKKGPDVPPPVQRVPVAPLANNHVHIDNFDTPEAKDAALEKRHLSSFDRFFLNRFTLPLFGRSKRLRAREAEAAYAATQELESVANVVDFSQRVDGNEEEDKKLRDEYYRAMLSRPK